jgi:hypothetical protein
VRSFDNFVAVDWSGAKGERQKGIAVAHCALGDAAPVLIDSPDGRWSRPGILDWLCNNLPNNSLVGFDLSPSLPFADEGSFFPEWSLSPTDAKSLWQFVDEICADDPHFSVTSFVNHIVAREHFRHGKGDCGKYFPTDRNGRLRETELRQALQKQSPSSCFNLVGAAQVGKSSLSGMRVFHRLEGRYPIWPFDPVPESGSVIVEMYTSIAARYAGMPKGRSKILDGANLDCALDRLGVAPHVPLPRYTDHATDAILTAAWLRKVADDPELWHPPGLEEVAQTEGWTFGVK